MNTEWEARVVRLYVSSPKVIKESVADMNIIKDGVSKKR